jgi:molybdopterin-guanine dinucleotide biosynthesis protein A
VVTHADRSDPAARRPLSALLLCGGDSRRFGSEKGLARFAGTPLAARLLQVLETLSDDVAISSNRPDLYRSLGVPVVPDEERGHGPLAGIAAGLRAARHDRLAVLACDMPFASAALFRHLAERIGDCDLAVPTHGGGPCCGETRYEPLHALYHRRCLEAIETVLRARERRIRAIFTLVRVREVSLGECRAHADVGPETFANINTPEDLGRLAAREGARGGSDGPGS